MISPSLEKRGGRKQLFADLGMSQMRQRRQKICREIDYGILYPDRVIRQLADE
jgi:hypothetical protein